MRKGITILILFFCTNSSFAQDNKPSVDSTAIHLKALYLPQLSPRSHLHYMNGGINVRLEEKWYVGSNGYLILYHKNPNLGQRSRYAFSVGIRRQFFEQCIRLYLGADVISKTWENAQHGPSRRNIGVMASVELMVDVYKNFGIYIHSGIGGGFTYTKGASEDTFNSPIIQGVYMPLNGGIVYKL